LSFRFCVVTLRIVLRPTETVKLLSGDTRDRSPMTGPSPSEVGDRLRTRRKEIGLSVRELARRVSVSASLISQVENGKATPSVGTLYAIVTEMGLSLDALFAEEGNGEVPARSLATRRGDGATGTGAHPPARILDPVVAPADRKEIGLASGVRWQRLTRSADPNVDFLYVIYEPGSASCAEDMLMRHAGQEYGYVISGRLKVTIGFDDHDMGAGDSISFASTEPHRLAAIGDEPVHAIWTVVGRLGDPRV
jgi:transcriptional regulator with XRE-family HTH domain